MNVQAGILKLMQVYVVDAIVLLLKCAANVFIVPTLLVLQH